MAAARGLRLLALAMLASVAAGMEFDMVYQTKCVMEEISPGVLVLGEYTAFLKEDPDNLQEVDVKVAPRQRQQGGLQERVGRGIIRGTSPPPPPPPCGA